MKKHETDPKGLIYESYRIEGITLEECRSIFLDWALSVGSEKPPQENIRLLLTRFGEDNPDHPMTNVLQEGLKSISQPRRRGGWRSRDRDGKN
jgi:hypothetical protein